MRYFMKKHRDRSAEQGFGLDLVAITALTLIGAALIAKMFASPMAYADTVAFDSNLYYGLTNNQDVESLQEFLAVQGDYSGPFTGNFFSLTLDGVQQFQSNNGLPITGYFGVLSRGVANNILITNTAGVSAAEIGTTTATSTQGVIPFVATSTEITPKCAVFTTPSGALIDCNGNVLFTPQQTQVIQSAAEEQQAPQVTQGVPQISNQELTSSPLPPACTLSFLSAPTTSSVLLQFSLTNTSGGYIYGLNGIGTQAELFSLTASKTYKNIPGEALLDNTYGFEYSTSTVYSITTADGITCQVDVPSPTATQ